MKPRLSEEQQKLVELTDGAHLVLASAGSGKTRILTERIRCLIENRDSNFRILGLTFTNKAAEEMKDRLQDITDLDDRMFIGTIHAFCLTVIEAHGKLVGYPAMPNILDSENDRLEIMREVMLENPELAHFYESKGKRDRQKLLYNVLNWISGKKRNLAGYGESDDAFESEEKALAFRDYEERLTSQGVIDFDDILVLAYRILTEHPKACRLYTRIYRYVCVDEAQDLNYAQYALIQCLAADNGNIMLVGDPGQAIYGFNGSDKRYMEECFPEDFPVTTHKLTQNYRSSRAVIQAGNALFPGKMDPSKYALPGKCVIRGLQTEADEAKWIAQKIGELRDLGEHEEIDGPIDLTKMMVLARNRYVFQPLEKLLTERGILFHHRRAGSNTALESDVGMAFDFGLRILINPRDRLHWRQLCERLSIADDAAPGGATGIERLRRCFKQSELRGDPWDDTLLEAWDTLSKETGINQFPALLDSIEEAVLASGGDEYDQDGSLSRKELIVEDLEFLRQTWDRYARSFQPDHRSLAHFRTQMSMGLTTPQEKLSGLTLATVHSAKGVEADIVFLIGMTEGTFPDYRAVRSGGRALEEEKNDAFVAMTRAKRWLYITYPKAKFMPWDDKMRVAQTPSRFVTSVIYQARNHENDQVMMVAEE